MPLSPSHNTTDPRPEVATPVSPSLDASSSTQPHAAPNSTSHTGPNSVTIEPPNTSSNLEISILDLPKLIAPSNTSSCHSTWPKQPPTWHKDYIMYVYSSQSFGLIAIYNKRYSLSSLSFSFIFSFLVSPLFFLS